MPFDAAVLSTLSRPALQKLAKEYQVKANLRSEVIIYLLTQRNAEYTHASRIDIHGIDPREFKQADEGNPSTSPGPPFLEGDQSPTFAGYIDPPTQPPPGLFQGDPLRKSQTPSDNSIYAITTPESLLATIPEPEATPELLRSTVEIIAGLAAIDQKTAGKVQSLRLAVETLRQKATDMRDLLKAERVMRRRLEDFCAHWMNINPRWTYDEVWAGELCVRNMQATREVTTSDEDDFQSERGGSSEGTDDQASGVTLSTRQESSRSQANRTSVKI